MGTITEHSDTFITQKMELEYETFPLSIFFEIKLRQK